MNRRQFLGAVTITGMAPGFGYETHLARLPVCLRAVATISMHPAMLGAFCPSLVNLFTNMARCLEHAAEALRGCDARSVMVVRYEPDEELLNGIFHGLIDNRTLWASSLKQLKDPINLEALLSLKARHLLEDVRQESPPFRAGIYRYITALALTHSADCLEHA